MNWAAARLARIGATVPEESRERVGLAAGVLAGGASRRLLSAMKRKVDH
jgi:hypothetical protein